MLLNRGLPASLTLWLLGAALVIGSPEVAPALGDVRIVVDRGYVVRPGPGFRVLDLSDPTAPALLGSFPGGPTFYMNDVRVLGDLAYVADGFNGLLIFDVSDPTAPGLAGAWTLVGGASDVEVQGGRAYVAGDGLWIFDLSDPVRPSPLATVAMSGEATNLELVGNLAYATTRRPGGLRILDVSTSTEAAVIGSLDLVTNGLLDLEVVGSTAYLGDYGETNVIDGSLHILDVTDPTTPSLLTSVPLFGHVLDVELQGDRAYVSVSTPPETAVFEVSDPAAPALLGSVGISRDIAVVGTIVYGVADYPYDPALQVLSLPPCLDDVDNDGDGLTDYSEDPGCLDANVDRSEEPECSDGLDNDRDGLTDHPPDSGCTSSDDPSERPDCSDGLDNDGDGLTDHRQDPGCASAGDGFETFDCDDGIDNDGDGFIDSDDPGCFHAEWPLEDPQCQDGLDNDGDGLIDFDGGASIHGTAQTDADPECPRPWSRTEWPRRRCGAGVELALLLPLWAYVRRRRTT